MEEAKEDDVNGVDTAAKDVTIVGEREKMEEAKEDEVNGVDTAAKDVTIVGDGDNDNDDEYTTDKIMQLVDSSSPSPTTNIDGANFSGEEPSFRVRFIDDPYAIPVVVQSYSGYITIDVNEESCGSSFADSDASVMASVDASGLFSGTWSTREVGASECDFEWDDDLLARFLGEDCV